MLVIASGACSTREAILYELRCPYGSNGNEAETAAIARNNAAQTYSGAGVSVLASLATTADTIPITRLHATAIALPVAR